MSIKKVSINEVEKAAVLFNAYRVFYKQESNLELAKEFLSSRIKNSESVIYCAFDEESKAVAFMQLYPSFSSVSAKKSWILNDLYVDEKHRRKGYARMLMQKAKELALETEAKAVSLQTAKDNKNAQSLYEDLGYIKDEEFYSYSLSV